MGSGSVVEKSKFIGGKVGKTCVVYLKIFYVYSSTMRERILTGFE